MDFTSKFHTSASIVAVVALMLGVLPGPAFAQGGGPPHAPTLRAPYRTRLKLRGSPMAAWQRIARPQAPGPISRLSRFPLSHPDVRHPAHL